MPAINGPADEYFFAFMGDIKERLAAIERQQNHGVTDKNGKLRLRWGLQPDGTFGLWALDPTTGTPVMKLDGSSLELLSSAGSKLIDLTDAGLAVYDTSGHELVKLDDTGQTVYNATGTEEVKLGDLGTGVYGLQVRNPANVMQTIGGRAITTKPGPLTYSSTTWGALSGAPSVTVVAPPSGEVDISLGAIMKPGPHTGGESCWLQVSLDGSGHYDPTLAASAGISSTQDFTCFGESTMTGLTPGTSYTFGVMAQVTTAGVTATFTNVTLKVVPV